MDIEANEISVDGFDQAILYCGCKVSYDSQWADKSPRGHWNITSGCLSRPVRSDRRYNIYIYIYREEESP